MLAAVLAAPRSLMKPCAGNALALKKVDAAITRRAGEFRCKWFEEEVMKI